MPARKSTQRSRRSTQPDLPSSSQRSTRLTKSQAGPSSSQGTARLSQLSIEQSFTGSQHSIENLEDHANKLVRYVLYRSGNNLPLRKADIQKNVLKNIGRTFDQVVTRATVILKRIYGYDLYLDQEANTKSYLVSNLMPYQADTDNPHEESEIPQDVHKILILLVLAHIFMSDNVSTEAALFSFLRAVQIDPDEKHDLFGNVKDFIVGSMVKQKYLLTEVEDVTKRVLYSWGPKADHDISKHSLLRFVCKMYKDRTPKSWTSQFQVANAQKSEDGEEIVENDEVEEESD